MTKQEKLGSQIKEDLKQAGLSQVAVARNCDYYVSAETINYVCQGKRSINAPLAVELERLGVRTAMHWLGKQARISINEYKSKWK